MNSKQDSFKPNDIVVVMCDMPVEIQVGDNKRANIVIEKGMTGLIADGAILNGVIWFFPVLLNLRPYRFYLPGELLSHVYDVNDWVEPEGM